MAETRKIKRILMTNQLDIVDNLVLDLDKLKTEMVKGIYNLEASLYKQSTLEQFRITKLRAAIGTLEDEIFSKRFLDNLEPKEKLFLYKLASENMTDLMKFLMDLHKTISDGTGILNNLNIMKDQSFKEQKNKQTTDMSDSEIMKAIQIIIKNKIIEKTK
jgi:hypothetical protein